MCTQLFLENNFLSLNRHNKHFFNAVGCCSWMGKGVTKTDWTVVCSMRLQCNPEVAALVLPLNCCAVVAELFHLGSWLENFCVVCLPVFCIVISNSLICRLLSFHQSCSIRLRQPDQCQVWHSRELLDKTSFLRQTNNNLHITCIMLLSR